MAPFTLMPTAEWTTNVPPPPMPAGAVASVAVPAVAAVAVPSVDAEPVVLGPVMTSSGFKFWYFVCDAEGITAAQVPFKNGLYSVLPYSIAPFFGLLGGLMLGSLIDASKRANQKVVNEFKGRPKRLKYAPNQTFRLSSMRSIQTKRRLSGAGGFGTHDIILQRANGTTMAFGAFPLACNEICLKLQQLYPGIFQV